MQGMKEADASWTKTDASWRRVEISSPWAPFHGLSHCLISFEGEPVTVNVHFSFVERKHASGPADEFQDQKVDMCLSPYRERRQPGKPSTDSQGEEERHIAGTPKNTKTKLVALDLVEVKGEKECMLLVQYEFGDSFVILAKRERVKTKAPFVTKVQSCLRTCTVLSPPYSL
ncbi:hypothetical protein E5288_WYG021292 [Bos mutus]|uniref:Uncharacterized protein n=1 Tax=Bos mutus TaxID=72004 RepID=A0A6B0RDW5_9CETA|nr:hypothetical protein [Bos mutus]